MAMSQKHNHTYEPWRYSCPRGHVNIKYAKTKTVNQYRCDTCKASFDKPIDKKERDKR